VDVSKAESRIGKGDPYKIHRNNTGRHKTGVDGSSRSKFVIRRRVFLEVFSHFRKPDRSFDLPQLKKSIRTFTPMGVRILRLAIEYTSGSTGKQYKQFQITFASFTDPRTLYETLITTHKDFFNPSSISPGKLKHFLSQMIKRAPSVDLREVSKEELTKYKEQMNRELTKCNQTG
jgi:hypothetical protein